MTGYTGDVTRGGPPAVRELTGLTVTKVSVGPMDNNAYLLRCTADGTQMLIDAANDADRLLALADQREDAVGLVGGVDQQLLARVDAAQQVGVVVHRAD